MPPTRRFPSRPALLALAAAAALGAALLLPVSFERTQGADLSLTVSAPGLDGDHVTAVLHEVMLLTHASGLHVEADVAEGAPKYRLLGSVGAASRARADQPLESLASVLRELGCEVTLAVTPRAERTRGNVAGLLAERWSARAGFSSSPSKLRQVIRAHLAAAGFEQEQVSLAVPGPSQRPPGDGMTTAPADTISRPLPEIRLAENSTGWTLSVRSSAGGTASAGSGSSRTLAVTLSKEGHVTRVEIANVDAMSRSSLAVALQAQLERAGVDARVHVQADALQVQVRPPSRPTR